GRPAVPGPKQTPRTRLTRFRSVDPFEPDAMAGDIDGIAVNHRRRSNDALLIRQSRGRTLLPKTSQENAGQRNRHWLASCI
ncbi:MAG: hypothetical protein KDJ18_05830, partial [Hyphomicrobiaceae bacterium]|nr:hypothetical protein [Hyphomicrobiaceae bacterium]